VGGSFPVILLNSLTMVWAPCLQVAPPNINFNLVILTKYIKD
jgi:hypothetical protein